MICDDCIHKMVCAKVYSDDWCAFKQTTETINAVIIPDNATNGEVIKALFPNAEFWDSTEFENEERINFEDNDCLECLNLDWWNAPYKKGENNGT